MALASYSGCLTPTPDCREGYGAGSSIQGSSASGGAAHILCSLRLELYFHCPLLCNILCRAPQ